MLILASTSDKINLLTSSTADTDVQVSYADFNAGAVALSRKNTAIVTATTTDISGSPAAATQRNIKHVSVRNKHASTSQVVTFQHTDGTTAVEIFSCLLAAGQQMVYDGEEGFRVYSTAGSLKANIPAPTITDDTTTNATMYPVWVNANTGNPAHKVSSTKMSFNPSTGALSVAGSVTAAGVVSNVAAGAYALLLNVTGTISSAAMGFFQAGLANSNSIAFNIGREGWPGTGGAAYLQFVPNAIATNHRFGIGFVNVWVDVLNVWQSGGVSVGASAAPSSNQLHVAGGVSIGTLHTPGANNLSLLGSDSNELGVTISNTHSSGIGHVKVVGDGAIATDFGVRGSARGAYGALVANDGYMYANSHLTFMADGTSSFIKFSSASTGAGTERMRLGLGLGIGLTTDPGSGNIGLKAIPSTALDSAYAGLLIGNSNLVADAAVGTVKTLYLSQNILIVGGVFKYISNGLGSYYRQGVGYHSFWSVPTGTAGATSTPVSIFTIAPTFIQAEVPVQLKGYTVADLATLTGAAGFTTYVSDADTPKYNEIVVGGGSALIPVFFDGTDWRCG